VNQAQYLAQIGAPAAWDLSTGSSQVIVAVLDSGIDLGHPDLGGRLWENPIDNLSDGIDRDNNGYPNDRYGYRFVDLTAKNIALCGYTATRGPNVQDDMGSTGDPRAHGTLVSGIIAAAGNNGQGVAGIAWNTRLMTVKGLRLRGQGLMANVAQGSSTRSERRASSTSASPDGITRTNRRSPGAADGPERGVIAVAAAGNEVCTAM
jgi:subtilisin family serine protease